VVALAPTHQGGVGRGNGMAFAGVLGRAWVRLVSHTAQANPRSVGYPVFGPVGTVADISYFYVNADPQQVPAVMGSVVARGDSNSIGCPIVVDGQVTAERIPHEVNAYPQCLVQGA
jgi:hypothetical protein